MRWRERREERRESEVGGEMKSKKKKTEREGGRQTGLTKHDSGTAKWVLHWPIRGFDT